MTSILYDAMDDLKDAFISCWNDTNNGGAKPLVELVWERKVTGFGNSKRDTILIEPIKEAITPFQLHGDTHWHELPVKLDIRTYKGKDRHDQVMKESSRIVKNIIRRSNKNFLDVIIKDIEPLTKDYRNMFRDVITLRYRDVESHSFV